MDRRFEIGQMAFVVTGVILAALGVDERNGDVTPSKLAEVENRSKSSAAYPGGELVGAGGS